MNDDTLGSILKLQKHGAVMWRRCAVSFAGFLAFYSHTLFSVTAVFSYFPRLKHSDTQQLAGQVCPWCGDRASGGGAACPSVTWLVVWSPASSVWMVKVSASHGSFAAICVRVGGWEVNCVNGFDKCTLKHEIKRKIVYIFQHWAEKHPTFDCFNPVLFWNYWSVVSPNVYNLLQLWLNLHISTCWFHVCNMQFYTGSKLVWWVLIMCF